MSKLFSGMFVTSLFVLLMTTNIHGQTQSASLSDDHEVEILEALLPLATKGFDSDFGSVRTFSSENLSSASKSRLKQHGFSLLSTYDIELWRREHVIDYVVIRSMYPKDGTVVVRLSVVSEGRPCFAPAFSTQRSFTYEFQKSGDQWVGRRVKGSAPFLFSRSIGNATVTSH